MLLLTFVSGNISTTISKNISQNTDNHTYKYKFVSDAIILSLTTGAIVVIGVIISKPLLNIIYTDMTYLLLLYLLPSIIAMSLYSPIMGYFWGENNYFCVSMVEFIEQIIRIVLSIILININILNNHMIAACIGLTIACAISSTIGYILYFKKAKFVPSLKYTKEIASSTIPLTLMRLVSSTIQPIINIIVPICLIGIGYTSTESLELIGIIFGMCMPIITIPSTIIGSINMVILPDVSASSKNNAILNNKIKTNFKLIIICSFIMLPIFMVLAEPICLVLYSNITVGYYLCFTSFLIIPMSIHQYFSSIMNALGKEKQNFIYSTISSVAMIIFILCTTRYFKIFALPMGLCLNAILCSILCIYSIKKTTHYNHNVLSDIILNIIITIPIIILDYFIYNILSLILSTIFCLVVISGISVIAYIALILTFQYIDIGYIHSFVKA